MRQYVHYLYYKMLNHFYQCPRIYYPFLDGQQISRNSSNKYIQTCVYMGERHLLWSGILKHTIIIIAPMRTQSCMATICLWRAARVAIFELRQLPHELRSQRCPRLDKRPKTFFSVLYSFFFCTKSMPKVMQIFCPTRVTWWCDCQNKLNFKWTSQNLGKSHQIFR